MKQIRSVVLASVAVMLIVTANACSDSAGPVSPRLDAVYIASSADGNPIPATITSGSDYDILLGDTLTFSSDGKVKVTTVFRQVSSTGTPRETLYAFNSTRPYQIDGKRLTIGNEPCPIGALCIGPDVGEIDESGIRLRHALWNVTTVFFFRTSMDD
jgi:hypothetical protein